MLKNFKDLLEIKGRVEKFLTSEVTCPNQGLTFYSNMVEQVPIKRKSV